MTELSVERKERYLEKLERMDERLGNIDKWSDKADLLEELDKRLAVYKAFEEVAETLVDICAMYVADSNKVVGDNRENIQKASGKLFHEDIEPEIMEVNALRNRLVHDYNGFEDSTAVESIERLKPCLTGFMERAEKWIRNN